jgi:hypothetical protein
MTGYTLGMTTTQQIIEALRIADTEWVGMGDLRALTGMLPSEFRTAIIEARQERAIVLEPHPFAWRADKVNGIEYGGVINDMVKIR